MLLYPFKYLKVPRTIGYTCRKHKERINQILTVIGVLFTFYLLMKIYTLQEYSKYSLIERREMTVSGESVINRDNNFVFWFIDYGFELLHTAIFPFVISCIIICYKKRIISQNKIVYLLLLYFLPPFLKYLIASNRAGLFFLVANASYFFFLFYKFMSKRLRKQIIKSSLLLLIPVSILLMFISLARAEDKKSDAGVGALSYFGEAFPNLNAFIYDQVGHYTYGMRLFSDYINLFTGYSIKADGGLGGYHQFWTKYTGAEILVFKTFFGDLYIEFGTIGAVLFIALFSALLTTYVKKSKHPYTCYAIFFILYSFATNAVLDFGLVFGKMYIIRTVFFVFCFGYIWRKYTGEGNAKYIR